MILNLSVHAAEENESKVKHTLTYACTFPSREHFCADREIFRVPGQQLRMLEPNAMFVNARNIYFQIQHKSLISLFAG